MTIHNFRWCIFERKKIMEKIDLLKSQPFCILNGQSGLHETEEDLYRNLANRLYVVNVLDNLFQEPLKLQALPFLKPKTLIVGTTGVNKEELRGLVDLFNEVGYIPENVLFTMGEELFTGMARKLRQNKPSMKFYSAITFGPEDIEIEEINWI